VDGGEVLTIPGRRRLQDKKRAVMAVSKTCLFTSIASRGGSRGWLETRATQMNTGKLVLLRIDPIEGVRWFAGERGED
jgi:hypothetical protein